MKRIYFTLTEDGYLNGYSDQPTPEQYKHELMTTEYTLEVDENHEVLRNPIIYRYVNGELIKDNEFQLKRVKEKQFNQLSEQCKNDILGYFQSNVKDRSYYFSYDQEAQLNFIDAMNLFNQDMIKVIEWTAYSDLESEAERITMDKEEFLNVYRDGFNHKMKHIKRLRNDLKTEVNKLNTIQEIKSINW